MFCMQSRNIFSQVSKYIEVKHAILVIITSYQPIIPVAKMITNENRSAPKLLSEDHVVKQYI